MTWHITQSLFHCEVIAGGAGQDQQRKLSFLTMPVFCVIRRQMINSPPPKISRNHLETIYNILQTISCNSQATTILKE
jgi:hypothetical protein